MIACEYFKIGDEAEIVFDCPFQGNVGYIAYVSEEPDQIEVDINLHDNREYYFRGIVNDVKKIKTIKRGNKVKEITTGIDGIISDIQYEFDRYQLENLSGWRYGIEHISKTN